MLSQRLYKEAAGSESMKITNSMMIFQSQYAEEGSGMITRGGRRYGQGSLKLALGHMNKAQKSIGRKRHAGPLRDDEERRMYWGAAGEESLCVDSSRWAEVHRNLVLSGLLEEGDQLDNSQELADDVIVNRTEEAGTSPDGSLAT